MSALKRNEGSSRSTFEWTLHAVHSSFIASNTAHPLYLDSTTSGRQSFDELWQRPVHRGTRTLISVAGKNSFPQYYIHSLQRSEKVRRCRTYAREIPLCQNFFNDLLSKQCSIILKYRKNSLGFCFLYENSWSKYEKDVHSGGHCDYPSSYFPQSQKEPPELYNTNPNETSLIN
ncbi:hypothetical protein ACFE04_000038 [Oxalis oulophora]